MRTKLKDRTLPDYTKGEERFNMISHIVGGALGIAALVLCIVVSAIHKNGYGLAGSIVYGVCMILLYVMSSIYHGLRPGTAKRVLQVLDHCSVYLLIAGTYTPILLSAMRPLEPAVSWMLLGVVWGLAILAIVLNAIDLRQFRVISMVLCLGIGWTIIFRAKTLVAAVGLVGFALVLSGGICYTVGAILYGLGKKKRYMHSIFHLFVLAGSILHLLAILLYVL